MDIIINDCSLCGQFTSLDDFEENLINDIIPALNHFKKASCNLYKSQNTYNNLITRNYTLYDLLIKRSSDALRRFKSIISNIICDEPFWDEDCTENTGKICLDEVIERKGILLSFKHFNFQRELIEYKKVEIKNSFDNNTALKHLYETIIINETYFYTEIKKDVQVRFKNINGRNYAQEAFDCNNFTYVDKLRIQEKLFVLFSCIANKTPLTDVGKYLSEQLYEFRCDISDTRTFRIFFMLDKGYIVFLNGFVKKTNLPRKVN